MAYSFIATLLLCIIVLMLILPTTVTERFLFQDLFLLNPCELMVSRSHVFQALFETLLQKLKWVKIRSKR